MGNNPSKAPGEQLAPGADGQHPVKPAPRPASKTLPSRHRPDHGRKYDGSSSPPSPQRGALQKSLSERVDRKHRHASDERSKPIAAPALSSRDIEGSRQRAAIELPLEPSGPPRASHFGPPPRLPLPISEELHTPGSPIINAQGDALQSGESPIGLLPRPASAASNTTQEDDDLSDELKHGSSDGSQRTVPMPVYWKQSGDKVYVTGTFTGWSRKFRMDRDQASGHLSTTLQLPPGTHHVKFIVDGEMRLSDELPTAVDYTNILVNYIEVSADDLPAHRDLKAAEHAIPPSVPEGTEAQDHERQANKSRVAEVPIDTGPFVWGTTLPPYLKDIDQPEGTNRYKRAANVVGTFSNPPGLPLFLGKSILNGTTPMKDDNSVLSMPNHTVLNHLATSSIKHEVLATSLTTRYDRKYVTTVVYKPTEA